MLRRSRARNIAPGIPVDAGGGPTVDPTKNVLDLVQAAVRRIDDLMEARGSLIDAKIQRLDDLQSGEARHIHEMASMRTNYEAELREKETERLDAIRAVDVAAVQRSAEVQEIRATTLAGQVAAAAEANRTSVAAAAAAFEAKLATTLAPLNEAVSDLRRMQFQLQGQTAEKADARSITTESRGVSQWTVMAGIGCLGVTIAGIGLLITLIGAAVTIALFLRPG